MSGSEDATARVWDLKAGALRQQRAHAGRAHGIVVAADGKTAASFGDDGALVWDTASGACLGALEVGAALCSPTARCPSQHCFVAQGTCSNEAGTLQQHVLSVVSVEQDYCRARCKLAVSVSQGQAAGVRWARRNVGPGAGI